MRVTADVLKMASVPVSVTATKVGSLVESAVDEFTRVGTSLFAAVLGERCDAGSFAVPQPGNPIDKISNKNATPLIFISTP